MMNPFSRSEPLFGQEGMARLRKAWVAVFGVGGVGGYAAEALVRSGVGHVDLFDNDDVALNLIGNWCCLGRAEEAVTSAG